MSGQPVDLPDSVQQRLRGLFVDDEHTFARAGSALLTRRLASRGIHVVFEVCGGPDAYAEALDSLASRTPDIVVTDIFLPPEFNTDLPRRDQEPLGLDIIDAARVQGVSVVLAVTQGIPSRLLDLRENSGADIVVLRGEFFTLTDRDASPILENICKIVKERTDPGYSPSTAEPVSELSAERASDDMKTTSVAVIYGRDERRTREVFRFLRSLGLRPKEWDAVIDDYGSGDPGLPEVLSHLFKSVQATVVLLTPDEDVSLKPDLVGASDATESGRQARPNVYYEMGLALGSQTGHVIVLEYPGVRPISDRGGRHTIQMDGSDERREQFRQRLQKSGCDLSTGSDWMTEGDLG